MRNNVTRNERGHWYWILYAGNGEAISRSSESYIAKADCLHSIRLNKASGDAPVTEA